MIQQNQNVKHYDEPLWCQTTVVWIPPPPSRQDGKYPSAFTAKTPETSGQLRSRLEETLGKGKMWSNMLWNNVHSPKLSLNTKSSRVITCALSLFFIRGSSRSPAPLWKSRCLKLKVIQVTNLQIIPVILFVRKGNKQILGGHSCRSPC